MDLTDFRAKAPALIRIPCPGLKPGVSIVVKREDRTDPRLQPGDQRQLTEPRALARK
jgi:hypothetical protein